MPALPYSLEALVLGRKRDLGGIIPDVVITEEHIDSVEVTTHPVDSGAEVADHAIVQPATLTCQFGWSDSSRLLNSALNSSILKGLETTKDVYERLLTMMRKRQPIAISTGKRTYESMLITELSTTTNAETESSLIITITLTEIVRVSTRDVLLAKATQKNPAKTASTTRGGYRQPLSVSGSYYTP